MKREFLIIAVGVLVLACGLFAAGEFKEFKGQYDISASTNTLDDSLVVSGDKYIGNPEGFKSLRYWARIYPAKTSLSGMGLSDSGYLWLYSQFSGTNKLIDSAVANSLPVTLTGVVHSNVGDTLIRERLLLTYRIQDTTSDTVLSTEYPLHWNIRLK